MMMMSSQLGGEMDVRLELRGRVKREGGERRGRQSGRGEEAGYFTPDSERKEGKRKGREWKRGKEGRGRRGERV